jgi:hypothetical protein
MINPFLCSLSLTLFLTHIHTHTHTHTHTEGIHNLLINTKSDPHILYLHYFIDLYGYIILFIHLKIDGFN